MNILAIDHITINVKDLDKAIEFYEKIMGLKQIDTINMGDHIIVFLKLTDGTKLELLKYLFETRLNNLEETTRGMYRHFCLQVSDLESIYISCIQNDVEVRKNPSYVEKLKANTMLIVDPNGVEIELVQK